MKDLKQLIQLLDCITEEKEIIRDFSGPWKLGEKYQITTVTKIYTGELVYIGDQELVLKDAAWIADTGRFYNAIKDQTKYSEVEPFEENEHRILIGDVLDLFEAHFFDKKRKRLDVIGWQVFESGEVFSTSFDPFFHESKIDWPIGAPSIVGSTSCHENDAAER